MAKTKVKKVVKKKAPVADKEVIFDVSNEELKALVMAFGDQVTGLSTRIDRIVTAISKAKSVKGL